MRQKLIKQKGETDKSIIRVADFNTPQSVTHRLSRQNIYKDIVDLNSTINQLDLNGIYRTFHPIIRTHFFSSSHRTFTKSPYFRPLNIP